MKNKKDIKEENEIEDVVIENEEEVKSSFKNKSKEKKVLELDDCKNEKQEYLDGWQRARAEMVNMKKQHDEEKKVFTSIGKEKMLLDLIPILDNFNAAFSSDSWENVDQNWRIGIEYIYKQFQEVLENNGIEEFGDLSDDVDFDKYEVLEEVDSDLDKGRIVKIIQKGYKKDSKIIRPAKIKISK